MILNVSVLGGDAVELELSPEIGAAAVIEACIAAENAQGAHIDPENSKSCEVYIPSAGTFLAHSGNDALINGNDPSKGKGKVFTTLQAVGLRQGDFIKIVERRKCGLIYVGMAPAQWGVKPPSLPVLQKSSHGVLTDFTDPLRRLIPTLMSRLKIKPGKEEYAMRLVMAAQKAYESDSGAGGESGSSNGDAEPGEFLNVNLSLNEQDVTHDSHIMLYPLGVLVQRQLGSYKAPVMEGWMTKTSQKADRKATGKKKRWCILDGNALVYFPDQKPGSKPKGIIDLEFMQISVEEKGNKLRLEKSTVSWTKRPLNYMFQPSEKSELATWERALMRRCVNGAPFQVFGISLNGLKERERDADVPRLLQACMDQIERKGLDGEGLFRVSGNASRIETWRDMCDRGRTDEVIAEFSTTDTDSIAGLLKLFLRELPEPILSYERYDRFIACSNEAAQLGEIVKTLPIANQVLLEKLLHFIALVESHKAKNKMDLDALVTVFAPNILRPRIETSDSLMRDSVRVNATVRGLITHRAALQCRKPTKIRHDSRRLAPMSSANVASQLLRTSGKDERPSSINMSASLIGPGPMAIGGGIAALLPPPPLATPPLLDGGDVVRAQSPPPSLVVPKISVPAGGSAPPPSSGDMRQSASSDMLRVPSVGSDLSGGSLSKTHSFDDVRSAESDALAADLPLPPVIDDSQPGSIILPKPLAVIPPPPPEDD